MPHKYDRVIPALATVFTELEACGLDDILSKGGVGTLLLAHKLDHEVVPGDKGADGVDTSGKLYEYKVSTTNQFNFNFGGRPKDGNIADKVRVHFRGLAGAFCALRSGATFTRIVYCESAPLVEDLIAYFAVSKSDTMVKNYRIESFAQLPGAKTLT